MGRESPLFIKSFEFLQWVLEHTKRFPAHQRFALAQRINDAVLDFHDHLIAAVRLPEAAKSLNAAAFHLERLKVYFRLSQAMKLTAFGQYEYAARELDGMGKLLTAWQKKAASAK